MGQTAKRFLFALRSPFYFRNMAPVVEDLLKRGHHVLMLITKTSDKEDIALTQIARLEEHYPNLQVKDAPRNKKRDQLELFWASAIDRLHFRRPIFRNNPLFAQRTEAKTHSPFLRTLEQRKIYHRFPLRPLLLHGLRCLLDALPPIRKLTDLIARYKPDLVLVCPLIDVGYPQFGILQAARARRVPSVLIVHSWDNLSSKSWISVRPDRILVWNEEQRGEAVRFHAVPRSRVEACGAPGYDVWIGRRPDTDRDTFLADLGLDPAQKTFLFVGSATYRPPFGDEWEVEFLKSWLSAVRSCSDPMIRDANVILRPHPKRYGDLEGLDLSAHGRIKVWPEAPENPATTETQSTFFQSVYHSDAVIGINTSAFLDAAVIGRPVFTILDSRFRASQEGTLHFRMLLGTGKGDALVRAAGSYEEHLDALRRALSTGSALSEGERAFLETFIRPAGWQRPAAEVVGDRLEEMASVPMAKPALHGRVRRKLLRPLTVGWMRKGNFRAKRRAVRKEFGDKRPEMPAEEV